MKIDDAKWNEIVQVARTGILKWSARAAEHGLKDQFRCHVTKTADGYTVLFTKHIGAWGPVETKTIIRDAGGEVRAAKARWKKGQIIDVTLKGPDPKAWAGLADKPPTEIVTRLRLLDFILVLGVRLADSTIIAPSDKPQGEGEAA
jgi:hypothetical protein